ncbi:MAG: glycine--tRNA ligase subunit beta [Dissulfurispiraceae bacterium]
MSDLHHIENSHRHRLVLEIGAEEIPARFLPSAILKLKESADRVFTECRLSFDSLKTFATPRRLSLLAEVDPLQSASEKEMWGPPANVAFNADGLPTKAAEAFMRSTGASLEDLTRKEKGKGSYVVAIVKEPARKTVDLLPEILKKLILSLNFPKSMRWADGTLRFARPIHWIFALYDTDRIRFELDGIKSSNVTRGHRFLSPASFEIKDSRAYINLLKNNFVVLDQEERIKIILEGANKLASSVNASLVEDEELLQHVAFLVEYPVPVLGTFAEEYLSLPKELLVTVMKDHQKYFALEDGNGNLTNYFIIISNTKLENAHIVRKGAERVIKARFEDARFYVEQDKKIPSTTRLQGLKKVVFHDRLGTIYQKTMRIIAIADFIAARCNPESREDVKTAALLSKTDLICGVVREFPELQGIIGRYYALNDGYGPDIAVALPEQYLPSHSGGKVPESHIGAIVSLSDKLDNVAAFFVLGLTPTGTEDPFALRRQTIAIISILKEKRYKLRISDMLKKALEAFPIEGRDRLLDELVKFFEQRIEPLYSSLGYSLDVISAVSHFIRTSPIYTIQERIEALRKFKDHVDYHPFLLAVKRVNNIAPKHDVSPVSEALFVQDEEAILYKEVQSIMLLTDSLIKGDQYYEAISLLMRIKEPINDFFDKVLIMEKREDIRENRLSLINHIKMLVQQIADFSKLN